MQLDAKECVLYVQQGKPVIVNNLSIQKMILIKKTSKYIKYAFFSPIFDVKENTKQVRF
jgi:hypothetical protein